MVRAKLGDAPYKVEIEASGQALAADEPADHGGAGDGATPFDLVLAGLAACTLITLRMYAERKGWAGFTASARLHYRLEDGRHLVDRRVEVSGAPDEAAVARLAEIAEKTPVTLALKAGFAIETKLTAEAAA